MTNIHYVKRTQGWAPSDPRTFQNVLAEVNTLAAKLPAEPAEADAETVCMIAEALEVLNDWLPPTITLWCVMKHYASYDAKTNAWAPTVWSAHLTQAQAEAFCPALDAHYNARARARGWALDTWTVERHTVRPNQIINPNLTAAEYVANLQ